MIFDQIERENMKPQIRVLGIDDSPFSFSDEKTRVIGVVMRIPNYIEGVMKTEVEVDGNDATDKLIEMITKSRYKEQLKAVMLDGIALGGFNVVDIEELNEKLQLPIITITRDEPDMIKIKKALEKNFDDWERRLELISKRSLTEIKTKHKPIFIEVIGIDEQEAKELINRSTVRGVLPEPIRIAHIIAAGIVSGESYGKA
jgi:endonuclease V-like protein UPF0215 family